MGQTLFNPTEQTKSLSNEIVIQITKKQIIVFCRFLVIMSMLALNALAISISSPFLKELLISQAILLLVYFIKTSKSNTILK
ncbi:hypothetical protein FDT66_13050 [Polaribacter aestuariivivens]|uniref:Uncharacterized protein n=1 Tax=Polaribacter aestuariivivens TaxID=2304626 RepID=A0A5S3N1C8_9FLAO|nr:hypothetical protein [Polaribacter aestuariivivens]TMM28827.1 hypothetical protein FDT66_13050 [Polaribacter aestuariivivens]